MSDYNPNDYPEPDFLSGNNNVASATECTGLIQGLPEEESEVKNFQEIYDIPKQGGLKKVKEKIKSESKK